MTDQDRITQLEAACAAMREFIEKSECGRKCCDGKFYMEFSSDLRTTSIKRLRCEICEAKRNALSTDAGKAMLNRLQKAEAKLDDVRKLSPMQDRLQAVEKQAKEDKEYIEDLCAQLCKMEDALGFKHDCTDKDGAFVPTIGPWLERVRDLIAAEGELGDTKDRLQTVERDNGLLKEQIRVADVAYQSLHERHQAVEKERDELARRVLELAKPDNLLQDLKKFGETLQPAQKEQK